MTIVDENVQSLPLETEADLVGVCGMGTQFERQREILCYYRTRGLRTKTPEQFGRELDLLRERAVHSVFFVDDII